MTCSKTSIKHIDVIWTWYSPWLCIRENQAYLFIVVQEQNQLVRNLTAFHISIKATVDMDVPQYKLMCSTFYKGYATLICQQDIGKLRKKKTLDEQNIILQSQANICWDLRTDDPYRMPSVSQSGTEARHCRQTHVHHVYFILCCRKCLINIQSVG